MAHVITIAKMYCKIELSVYLEGIVIIVHKITFFRVTKKNYVAMHSMSTYNFLWQTFSYYECLSVH